MFGNRWDPSPTTIHTQPARTVNEPRAAVLTAENFGTMLFKWNARECDVEWTQ